MKLRAWIGSFLLLAALAASVAGLANWKHTALQQAAAAAADQPEPAEAVTVAIAAPYDYRPSSTAIGTMLALRSITLRNEMPGTVAEVMLTPGQIVEAGTVLVALDVSVEQAEREAMAAEAALAEAVLARRQQLVERNAISEEELERARADRDVALAQIARIEATIARKTIRAPFRARVGLADLHPGQYLNAGTLLTTLQGVDRAAHVDFAVEQRIAAGLQPGDPVEVVARDGGHGALTAKIVAVDARIDPATRNAMVRTRIEDAASAPAPGASVQVRVPSGPPQPAVAVPASALRKGPAGDHVFVLEADAAGSMRARLRSVEVSALLGDEVVIEAGLAAGEQVAASGSFKLRDAALVALADEPVAAAGTGS